MIKKWPRGLSEYFCFDVINQWDDNYVLGVFGVGTQKGRDPVVGARDNGMGRGDRKKYVSPLSRSARKHMIKFA